jgi:hypothetical protein
LVLPTKHSSHGWTWLEAHFALFVGFAFLIARLVPAEDAMSQNTLPELDEIRKVGGDLFRCHLKS